MKCHIPLSPMHICIVYILPLPRFVIKQRHHPFNFLLWEQHREIKLHQKHVNGSTTVFRVSKKVPRDFVRWRVGDDCRIDEGIPYFSQFRYCIVFRLRTCLHRRLYLKTGMRLCRYGESHTKNNRNEVFLKFHLYKSFSVYSAASMESADSNM